ncbi:hypothetical protein JL720_1614 [Aureococcus anophagefferens]|nr:hypothetical protein JL720_1614 [Aureococcus anophagefferens]
MAATMEPKLALYLRSAEHACTFKVAVRPGKRVEAILRAFAQRYRDDADALTLVAPSGCLLGGSDRVGDVLADGDVLDVVREEVLPVPGADDYAARAGAAADAVAAAADAAANTYATARRGESDFEKWMATYADGPLVHKVAHYFDVYERHFSRFRGRRVVMLEIGVQSGGSIELWRAYFGDDLEYHGVDINPNCAQFDDPARNVHVHVGDATDANFMQALARRVGPVDVVLDDGSHESAHMRASFEALYALVAPRGVYLVEDCMTNYWRPWGGGVGADTFIEFAKRLVDSLNAFNVADGAEGYTDPTNPPTRYDDVATMPDAPAVRFAASTWSLCFYDGVVVFERMPRTHFTHIRRGNRSIPRLRRVPRGHGAWL